MRADLWRVPAFVVLGQAEREHGGPLVATSIAGEQRSEALPNKPVRLRDVKSTIETKPKLNVAALSIAGGDAHVVPKLPHSFCGSLRTIAVVEDK